MIFERSEPRRIHLVLVLLLWICILMLDLYGWALYLCDMWYMDLNVVICIVIFLPAHLLRIYIKTCCCCCFLQRTFVLHPSGQMFSIQASSYRFQKRFGFFFSILIVFVHFFSTMYCNSIIYNVAPQGNKNLKFGLQLRPNSKKLYCTTGLHRMTQTLLWGHLQVSTVCGTSRNQKHFCFVEVRHCIMELQYSFWHVYI